MAESTSIAWCTSSFSPWIGCTSVSPGCKNCYAEAMDRRKLWGGATHWGAGVPRHRTSASYWQQPIAWNKKAAASGERWTVFPSLCDPFDNEVPSEWRDAFYALIRATPFLTWLILTKRIGNWTKLYPSGGFINAWIGASVVNQEEADRDIPKLLAVPAAMRFVSYEPALSAVDWTGLLDGISQVIVGGESSQGGHKAREFNIEWARSTIRQCKAAGTACFVKQLGASPWFATTRDGEPHIIMVDCKDRAGADPDEWPADLRVQEFP